MQWRLGAYLPRNMCDWIGMLFGLRKMFSDGVRCRKIGNRRMLSQVLGITLSEDVPRLRQALDEAELSGNPEQLEQAAHAIQGLAAELRAQPTRAGGSVLGEKPRRSGRVDLARGIPVLVAALEKVASSPN